MRSQRDSDIRATLEALLDQADNLAENESLYPVAEAAEGPILTPTALAASRDRVLARFMATQQMDTARASSKREVRELATSATGARSAVHGPPQHESLPKQHGRPIETPAATTAAGPRRSPGTHYDPANGASVRRAWRSRYVRLVGLGDFVTTFATYSAAQIWSLGGHPTDSFAQALAFAGALLLSLGATGAYSQRHLLAGVEEFKRVALAASILVSVMATASWVFSLHVAAEPAIWAVLSATAGGLGARAIGRRSMHKRQDGGQLQRSTVIVGHRSAVMQLHKQLEGAAHRGLHVIGCCVPTTHPGDSLDGLPILGDYFEIANVVREYHVDTVAVLPSPELDGPAMRRLGWDLETSDVQLLLAPSLAEVAGPRAQVRAMAGLPLLQLDRPDAKDLFAKALFDRLAAATLLMLFSPLLLGICLMVKVSGPGPVIYRSERVGKDGKPFSLLKFRTLHVDSDKCTDPGLTKTNKYGARCKMCAPPRVTHGGQLLRRFSLDELPQLWNVLRGDMSLVGPRPHRVMEVERYPFDMRRRLLVRPGITGLWQFSGRSDLSWDDSMRLDLRYVENWSLSFDVMILFRTVAAVFKSQGGLLAK